MDTNSSMQDTASIIFSYGSMIYSNWPKDNVSDVIECWYVTRSEKKWTIRIYSHAEPIDDMRSIRTIEITKRDENSCDIVFFIRFERKDPENSPWMANMAYPSIEKSTKRMFFMFDYSLLTHHAHTHTHTNQKYLLVNLKMLLSMC